MSNLNKLSIDDLFQTRSGNGILDVESLFPPKSKTYGDTKFDFDKIVDHEEKKKEEKRISNKHILKACLKEISKQAKYQKTSINYQVPIRLPKRELYNPYECVEYLIRKLTKKHKMDVYKISDLTIYISWFSLLQDKLKEREKNKKHD